MVAQHIEASGLRNNSAFLASLEKLLEETAVAPMFALFAAIDGEGSFAEDVQVELRIVGGEEVSGHLHEILSPINEDLIPPGK